MKKLLMLLLGLLAIGCSDDVLYNSAVNQHLTSYDFKNMQYDNSVIPTENNRVALEYQGQRIIRRTGGLRAIDQSTGYNYFSPMKFLTRSPITETGLSLKKAGFYPGIRSPETDSHHFRSSEQDDTAH